MDRTAHETDSNAMQAALALLASDPLPADVIEQLEQLEAQAGDAEAEKFGDLWEALFVAQPELFEQI